MVQLSHPHTTTGKPQPWLWTTYVCVLSHFSRVWLFVTPCTVAHQASLSRELSRQAYWSGLPFPFPGDFPNPGIEPGSSALQADSLPSEPPGKLRIMECTVISFSGGPSQPGYRAPVSRKSPTWQADSSFQRHQRGCKVCWYIHKIHSPWDTLDHDQLWITWRLSAPTRRAEIRGAKFNNKQKEKAEWMIQEIPWVSAEQHSSFTLLASWVSEGPPPPRGCICITPTKPSIPLPEQEESQHQGKSRAGTHNPGSSKQSATPESPAHCGRTPQPLSGGAESMGSQVRPPGSSPISATWERCDLKWVTEPLCASVLSSIKGGEK